MTSIGKHRWRWIGFELFLMLAAVAGSALSLHFGMQMDPSTILVFEIRLILILAFLFLGWRDILMLVRRPPKMGPGVQRVWAVARTTVREAWAGRVWLLPLFWFFGSLMLISGVTPFLESERMPLYARVLLMGQEILVLVMLGVMACVSYPREREKKIAITNASKPLSRLETVLGKMTGFSVMAAGLIVVMGLASWGILAVSNQNERARATEQLKLSETDLAKLSQEDKLLSQEGSLFAYNYIQVPPGGMSIVGNIDFGSNPPVRYLKGGSDEKVDYRFWPNMPSPIVSLLKTAGYEACFRFLFPVIPYAADPPKQVQIRVAAWRSGRYVRPEDMGRQEKVLTLNAQGQALFMPDSPEAVQSLFSEIDEGEDAPSTDHDLGEVTVEVSCLTPGVFLQIYEGAAPDPVTHMVPEGTQFNVLACGNLNLHNPQWVTSPMPNPVVRGFERRDREEVAGPKDSDLAHLAPGGKMASESAIYRFPAESLRGIRPDPDGNFTVALNLSLDKTFNQSAPTMARVLVISAEAIEAAAGSGQLDMFKQEMEVQEKRLAKLQVPIKYLGNADEKRRGDLYVVLQCETKDHALAILDDSVRIELPQTPFVVNLFKSEMVIFLEAALLIAICVTCSVRLGWPVAMLLAVCCYLFGAFVDYIGSLQTKGGLASLGYFDYGGTAGTAYHILDKTTMATWKMLDVIATVVPNFTIYQPSQYISELRNMPGSVLGADVGATAMYLLPIIALAYLLARKQELG